MIACRSIFIRVEQAFNFTDTYQLSKPARYFQRCCFCGGLNYNWKMNGAKGKQSGTDQKKRNSTACVWRPMSALSCSIDEKYAKVELETSHSLSDGEKLEIGNQTAEVHYSISSCVLNSQQAQGEAEVVSEPAEPNLIPTALQDNNECREPEGGSDHSVEKHSISIKVASSLVRFIKGKGGSMQGKIEEEMGVEITFPSSKKDESITIEGVSAASVARASERIQQIIDEAVNSSTLDYSHFVSLPLAIHPQLVDKLVNFQNSVLGINDPNHDVNLDGDSNRDTSDEEGGDQELDEAPQLAIKLEDQADNEHVKVTMNIPLISYAPKAKTSTISELGIEKSIFIKPKTFHLTVLMLKLWNKRRVDAAAEILQSVSAKVMEALDNRPVSIRLKGLDCMRGSLAKACVLYAPVEEVGGEDRLMRACKVIIDAFVESGLVLEKDSRQMLKLHATLMNARHRKRKLGTKKFDTFDARGIVKQYGSEEWGEYLIREAHLSQRFVFDENGYYHCCASLPFPENMQVE